MSQAESFQTPTTFQAPISDNIMILIKVILILGQENLDSLKQESQSQKSSCHMERTENKRAQVCDACLRDYAVVN